MIPCELTKYDLVCLYLLFHVIVLWKNALLVFMRNKTVYALVLTDIFIDNSCFLGFGGTLR